MHDERHGSCQSGEPRVHSEILSKKNCRRNCKEFTGDSAGPDNELREVIGVLGYTTLMTRPDTTFTQGHLARSSLEKCFYSF